MRPMLARLKTMLDWLDLDHETGSLVGNKAGNSTGAPASRLDERGNLEIDNAEPAPGSYRTVNAGY
jgi:hypothetical protein